MFVFLDHERYGNSWYNLKLRGLKPEKRYCFELNGKEQSKTGEFLMNAGISLILKGDYDSLLIRLKEVK